MNELTKNWQEYGGRLFPRAVIAAIQAQDSHIPSRIRVGEQVKVAIGDQGVAHFIDALCVDVHYSEQAGWSWDLAFPIADGNWYSVIRGFTEDGIAQSMEDVPGPYTSGIFTHDEYQIYLDSLQDSQPNEAQEKTFRVVK